MSIVLISLCLSIIDIMQRLKIRSFRFFSLLSDIIVIIKDELRVLYLLHLISDLRV